MTAKNLVILAAATAAIAGAAYMMARGRAPADASVGAENSPLFVGLESKAGEVARIEIKKGTSDTVLVKDESGKGWLIENRGGYPAKFDLVRPVVAALAEAKMLEAKTSKAELYDKLDLGDPTKEDAKSTLVTLKAADGKEIASLILGKRDWGKAPDPFSPPPPGKAKHYVRKGTEPQSYLAEIELEVQADPLSFADKQVLELKNEEVKSAVVARPDGEIIAVYREKPEDTKYQIKDLPAGRAPKDEFAASRVAQALSYVSFEDVKPASEIDFNAPEAITYEARCFDGVSVTVRTVNKDGKTWAKFSAAFEEPAPPAPPAAPTPPTAAPPAANAAADVTSPAGEGEEGDAAKAAVPPPAPPAAPAPTDADAKAAEEARVKAIEASKKEVADWNAKWGKWAYALPQFKVDQLATKMEDLLAPKPAEQNPPSEPEPALNPDGSSLLMPPPK